MSTSTSSDITRAGERYLEQYGDPLVMNTYLKITILVLAVVCLTLAALTFESQKSLANMHPMIVESFPELVSNDFKTGPQPARVERDSRFLVNDSIAFIPPRCIGITMVGP